MNIVFRVDASVDIGTGHVMRCLTLAKEFMETAGTIKFICRALPGNLISFIQSQGIHVDEISSDENDIAKSQILINSYNHKVELLIVDHYGLDNHWESKMRPFVGKIMVIDDLANRNHDCDILLDQNYYLNINDRYVNLVPDHCKLLLGPKYVVIRDEFIDAAKNLKERSGNVNNILVFFGGSDPTNETEKTLHAIKPLTEKYDFNLDVVVGNANPKKMKIKEMCSDLKRTNFHCQVSNMAELMAKADFSIGAGGSTTWERCFLKLPSITIVVASNQREITQAVAIKGATINLGDSKTVSIKDIQQKIIYCIENPGFVKEISNQCIEIINSNNVFIRDLTKMIQEDIS